MAKQNSVNQSVVAHGIQVGNAAGDGVASATLTNGQLLIGSTGAAPVAATLSAGAGISITPGAGSLTITNTGGGGGGISSVTGANGLQATTVGGAVTVGVQAVAPTINTSGVANWFAGDGATTSGDIQLVTNFVSTDPGATGSITIQTQGGDGGAALLRLESGGAPNTPSSGNMALQCASGGGAGCSGSGNFSLLASGSEEPNCGQITLSTYNYNFGDTNANAITLNCTYVGTIGLGDTYLQIQRDGTNTATTSQIDIKCFQVMNVEVTGGNLEFVGVQFRSQAPIFIDVPALSGAQALQIAPTLEPQAGTAVLVAGTVTVTASWVTSANIIVASHRAASGTIGYLECVPGTGTFTINSLQSNGAIETNDTSTVQYWII